MRFILASKSPRRQELLKMIVPEFDTVPADIDEHAILADDPESFCSTLAKQKCLHIFSGSPDACVIGSDTVVACDGTILGKPRDFDDEMSMLRMLSGRTHQVHTGVHIEAPGVSETFCVTTDVTFSVLSEKEMKEYAESSDPYDKAGGYGIQSGAARFCERINGDYFSVMGLPVNAIYKKLKEHGLI